MRKLATFTAVAALVAAGGLLLTPGIASAQTAFGTGPGCSAIGDVVAMTLVNGDTFTGRISKNAITGLNPKGFAVDNSDADIFTDSLEECIEDSLIGSCLDINVDDSGVIGVVDGADVGKNQTFFTVTFLDVSGCS